MDLKLSENVHNMPADIEESCSFDLLVSLTTLIQSEYSIVELQPTNSDVVFLCLGPLLQLSRSQECFACYHWAPATNATDGKCQMLLKSNMSSESQKQNGDL